MTLNWKIADLLFPPLCIACREPLGQGQGFCASCWSKISFLDGPLCDRCGLPFGVDPGPGALCAACLTKPPSFDRARAIIAYDKSSRGPILALKHADRLELVPGFAQWLARTGKDLIEDSELIVPVPLAERPFRCGRWSGAGHRKPGRDGLGQSPPPQCAGCAQGSGSGNGPGP